MRYKANRGGHAPGFLRDAFQEFIDSNCPDNFTFFDWELKRSLNWLLGQLWNCIDIMPSSLCGELDLEMGSSYAIGVRKIKKRKEAQFY